MAKRTEAPPAYRNPEVRYEREDIADAEVTWYGVGFAAVVVGGAMFALWVAASFVRAPLPGAALPAALDDSRRPPEPRLEALMDLETRRPRLFPPRAADYLAPQAELLEKGEKDEKDIPIMIPIEKAFREMTFPSSKGEPAPSVTPNRSTAGRDVKGGGG